MINLRNIVNTQSPWKIKGKYERHMQRRRVEATSYLLSLQKSDVVLDVGCGKGFYLKFITPYVSHAVGLDISKDALKKAKIHIPNADLVLADCNNMPFRANVFSKIMLLEILEHTERPKDVVTEADRCLKKLGFLVVSTPYRERISQIQCPWCKKKIPIFGHLHSFSEENLFPLFASYYKEFRVMYVANPAVLISPFEKLPFKIWIFFNRITNIIFGKVGYWIIVSARKKYF